MKNTSLTTISNSTVRDMFVEMLGDEMPEWVVEKSPGGFVLSRIFWLFSCVCAIVFLLICLLVGNLRDQLFADISHFTTRERIPLSIAGIIFVGGIAALPKMWRKIRNDDCYISIALHRKVSLLFLMFEYIYLHRRFTRKNDHIIDTSFIDKEGSIGIVLFAWIVIGSMVMIPSLWRDVVYGYGHAYILTKSRLLWFDIYSKSVKAIQRFDCEKLYVNSNRFWSFSYVYTKTPIPDSGRKRMIQMQGGVGFYNFLTECEKRIADAQ